MIGDSRVAKMRDVRVINGPESAARLYRGDGDRRTAVAGTQSVRFNSTTCAPKVHMTFVGRLGSPGCTAQTFGI